MYAYCIYQDGIHTKKRGNIFKQHYLTIYYYYLKTKLLLTNI